MDIKNPEYILEIARQQSVTHAAEKLFVTQSTLSQYLLKLENELGTPLFSREKRAWCLRRRGMCIFTRPGRWCRSKTRRRPASRR